MCIRDSWLIPDRTTETMLLIPLVVTDLAVLTVVVVIVRIWFRVIVVINCICVIPDRTAVCIIII